MNTVTQERYKNPDELLVSDVHSERIDIINYHDAYIDEVVMYMKKMQEKLGDTASNHFVPKDYTIYEALPSEPAPEQNVYGDAYEKAVQNVGKSSQTQTQEIDADIVRMLIDQSYIDGGIQDAQDYANSNGVNNVR